MLTDADLPSLWHGLGIPGVCDVHTHFMPEAVMRSVWAYFDAAGDNYGVPWPIEYRWDDDARLNHLRALGVRKFTALVYAHKPGMAEWLSRWALDFASHVPDCLPTATFYPEPEAERYVSEALARGAQVFKVHLQVGTSTPRSIARPGMGFARGCRRARPHPLRVSATRGAVHRSRTDR